MIIESHHLIAFGATNTLPVSQVIDWEGFFQNKSLYYTFKKCYLTYKHFLKSASPFSLFPLGSWPQSSLHRLRPQHAHREDLRWSQEVHAAYHVRRSGPASYVAAQQQPGCGQCVLFYHRTACRAAEGEHEREDRVRPPGTHPVSFFCGREGLELQLPRQSEYIYL